MTARKHNTETFLSGESLDARWKNAPKSLREQDAEWARQECIRARAEERARRRQQEPAC